MNVEIINEKENKLFGRKEITANIDFTGPTPKRAEIKTEIAGKVAANPDNSVLREVKNEFGITRVHVLFHTYENKENMMKNEPAYILVREGCMPKPEKKKKEKKAAAPKKK